MYRNILLATDLSEVSENALLVALNMARHFRARLHVLHALESPYVLYRGLVGDRLTGRLRQADAEYVAGIEAHLEKELAGHLEGFEGYSIEVREGLPFVEILRLAKKSAADLIVMGPHTRRAAEQGLMRAGSTMLRVAAKARCPVLVAGRLEWRGIRDHYERVLFASDLSPGCEGAFGVARALASDYRAELSLLHVLNTCPQPGRLYPPQEEIEEELRAAAGRLEELYGPGLGGAPPWHASCCEGVPFVEILKAARDGGADVIVLGPHTGAESERAGNTAEQVGLRAGCPVMIVPRQHPAYS